jgi:CobQ-like glutamine amidotransferase family enzyme
MLIEVLYPELQNLYGDLANIRYMQRSIPGCEIRETSLGSKPAFISGGVDLVYRGTMTESAQRIFVEELGRYKGELRAAIDGGQHFLITGNALETFGSEIRDSEGEIIKCLGIFEHHAERNMLKRFNSLYVGKYGDTDIVGYKSQFGHSYPDGEIEPLFETERGPGLNPDMKGEGVRYKNYMATYLIGPLMVLNPDFMKKFCAELGVKDVEPLYYETAEKAFEMRLKEYRDPDTGFSY